MHMHEGKQQNTYILWTSLYNIKHFLLINSLLYYFIFSDIPLQLYHNVVKVKVSPCLVAVDSVGATDSLYLGTAYGRQGPSPFFYCL